MSFGVRSFSLVR